MKRQQRFIVTLPEPKSPPITDLFPMTIHTEVIEQPKQQEMEKWNMLEEIRDLNVSYEPGTVIYSTFEGEPPDVWPIHAKEESLSVPVVIIILHLVVVCAYLISRELRKVG